MVDEPGCVSCEKCTLCKNFLRVAKVVTSPNTNQTFLIKSRITCLTKNVVYVIYDKVCPTVFYVGYTCDNMRERWTTHKSHIKTRVKSCEIASHFINLENTSHRLDRNPQAVYTSQLSKHLEVLLIECVEPVPGVPMKKVMEGRETFWKGALKAFTLFGGINKR